MYACMCARSLRLCSTLCNRMDCSLPGSSVCEILQARILEWVAISFPRGSSWSRDWTHISCVSCICRWILYLLSHCRSPLPSYGTPLTALLLMFCVSSVSQLPAYSVPVPRLEYGFRKTQNHDVWPHFKFKNQISSKHQYILESVFPSIPSISP